MSTVTIVLLVILVILIAALIGLYFFGKKAQKKQEEQQAQIEATKQTVSMLVIDKKRMPLKESGLPQMVNLCAVPSFQSLKLKSDQRLRS